MGHVVMLVRNLQQFVEIVALGNICTIRTRKPSFQIRCLRYLKTVAADMATFSTSECKCQRLDGKVAVVTASTAGCVLYYRDAGYMRICDRIFCQNPHIACFSAFSKRSVLGVDRRSRTSEQKITSGRSIATLSNYIYHIINVRMQPYFFTALPVLWLGLKYQSLCYQLPNLFKNNIFLSLCYKETDMAGDGL